MGKYIQLYEEYTEKLSNGLNMQHSWQEIRDVLQKKLPFIIIDFDSLEDMNKCIEDELYDEDYMKQKYIYKDQDANEAFRHSVFIFANGGSKLSNRVLKFKSRFDIFRIVIGEFGEIYPKAYIGEDQVDLGGNLFTSISRDEMGFDDYYSIDSNFYKFIN